MTERYAWRGGEEMLLRHGEGARVTLLVLPALFEEANRMRRFTVGVMRHLAARGIGSVLPDLPGTGESLRATADATLDDWAAAAAALAAAIRAAQGRCLSVAIRGGAILDSVADAGWRLAPESGERVLRDMVRATALTGGRSASDIDKAARIEPTALAGNVLAPALYTALMTASLAAPDRRVARLADDAGPRDVSLAGTRLWRAAEPGYDEAMAAATAEDIAAWVAACAA